MRNLWFGALALLLVLAAGGAQAQVDPLHNVKSVKLTLGDLGQAADACGLTKPALEAAFFQPLEQRGIVVVTSGTGYRLFLRATTITYLEGSCVSYVDAQLLLTTRYQDAANQQERSGHVQLWADGGLYASDASEHGTTLERAMRRLGEKLAVRWETAN